MEIILVRHGEAAAHWGEDPDPGLSALGARQAQAAAEALLPGLDADVSLVSSPLRRARETADPIARTLGLQVAINDAFCEIPAPVPLAQRRDWLRGFMRQEWAEQPAELLRWRDCALEQLHSLQQPTVVFTHFLVLNAIVGSILARPETLYFWPDNASCTRLNLSNNTLELVELGAQMETIVN